MIMKTSCELEKKLKKLPRYIYTGSPDKEKDTYYLYITKNVNDVLNIYYKNNNNFVILDVEHQSLQSAVDNTLASLKKIE